jgi:hypothetical protein
MITEPIKSKSIIRKIDTFNGIPIFSIQEESGDKRTAKNAANAKGIVKDRVKCSSHPNAIRARKAKAKVLIFS